jgi:hypothetical protein
VEGSLLDLPGSEGPFDYINCTGVLHQLKHPEVGLRALSAVLKPKGAMALMLYGYHGRRDIYRMQEMLRGVNHSTPNFQDRIANTSHVLEDMPVRDWQLNPQNKVLVDEDIQTPAGLYDLLLPRYDVPYTVPQVYDFLASAGLQKIAFVDPIMGGELGYRPELYLTAKELAEPLSTLTQLQREYVAELASGEMARHAFYAAKGAQRAASVHDPNIAVAYSMSFNQGAQQEIQQLAEDRPSESLPIAPLARHDRNVQVTFGQYGAALLRNIDGLRSMQEIVDTTGTQTNATSDVLRQAFMSMYEPLHAADWLTLRHRAVPPWPSAHDIQQRWLNNHDLDRPVELECFVLRGLQGLAP